MKYAIVTYGCQMNSADSGLMAAVLDGSGWRPAESRDEADLIVLNTCSVRERPEHKAYSLLGELREWRRSRSAAVLAVSGCMAQRAGEHILARAPHVDIIIGTRHFHRIAELAARVSRGERPLVELGTDDDPSDWRCGAAAAVAAARLRAFVPVIRGCSNFCSYCIVPRVRGSEASRAAHDIEREIESLVSRGTREVTVLGQNVLAYGRDLPEGLTFAQLLERLEGIDGLWRIRFTTCHPRDVSDGVVRAIAGLSKVCEHIHLPIQAGTDRLLEEMNRGYTTEHYLDVVTQLRSRVPAIAISTDMMVGFPGETEEDFCRSLRLYERIRFDSAFTFAYSPRPGTAAAGRPDQVPRQTRLARLSRLIELQNQIAIEVNQRRVGEEVELLVDGTAHRGRGLLSGRTRTNKQTLFAGDTHLIGTLANVRLVKAHLWGFMGELLVQGQTL
jgi:tRNA-2-methylthio-N6-dimethylallyladenosine synthase